MGPYGKKPTGYITAGSLRCSTDRTPEKLSYRSTRQLVGRLFCMPRGRTEIRYDLLDGNPLELKTRDNEKDRSCLQHSRNTRCRYLIRWRGVTAEKDTIAYCRIGERSSYTWFALEHLLDANVHNYDGSWTEWGT